MHAQGPSAPIVIHLHGAPENRGPLWRRSRYCGTLLRYAGNTWHESVLAAASSVFPSSLGLGSRDVIARASPSTPITHAGAFSATFVARNRRARLHSDLPPRQDERVARYPTRAYHEAGDDQIATSYRVPLTRVTRANAGHRDPVRSRYLGLVHHENTCHVPPRRFPGE